MKFSSCRQCLVALALILLCLQQQLLAQATDSCVMPVPEALMGAVFGQSQNTTPTELQNIPADDYTQCVTQCCSNTTGQCNVLKFKPPSDSAPASQSEPNCVLYHCDSLDGCTINSENGAQIYADSEAVAAAMPSTTASRTGSTGSSPSTTVHTQQVNGSTTSPSTTTQQQQQAEGEVSHSTKTTPIGSTTDKDVSKEPAFATKTTAIERTTAVVDTGGDNETSTQSSSSSSTALESSQDDAMRQDRTTIAAATKTTATEQTTAVADKGGDKETSIQSFSSSSSSTTLGSNQDDAMRQNRTTTAATGNTTNEEDIGKTTADGSANGTDIQGKPGNNTAGLSDDAISAKSPTTLALLISALLAGCTFFLVATGFVGKRVFDSWRKRHYCRVERDYLVDGMYAK